MKIIEANSPDFAEAFDELLKRGGMDMRRVTQTVQKLLDEVRSEGDDALLAHVAHFDRWRPSRVQDLIITPSMMKEAWDQTDQALQDALKLAADRIRRFHEKQLPKSWIDYEESGTMLGQKVTAVDRAGLYIPGGKAAYPSSLLMNAIPAQVAGVKELVVCVPAPDNELDPLVLAAGHLCGIDRIFKVGGASAIGAMAYGTLTVPKVDVITGPGNIFVATAKKLVFGEVNIDMIAGPSEIGIIADSSAKPSQLAMDLLSQAEHDEMASSILITPSKDLALKVVGEIYHIINRIERGRIARESIENRGAVILAKDLDEACALMNRLAPEHLEILTRNPHALLPLIRHAGAIFLGEYSPEAIGDYVAGPNHTLPTGGTARFFSPLGVENFMKKSSIISFSRKGFDEVAAACELIAKTEGLTAHGLSVTERMSSKSKKDS